MKKSHNHSTVTGFIIEIKNGKPWSLRKFFEPQETILSIEKIYPDGCLFSVIKDISVRGGDTLKIGGTNTPKVEN